MSAMAKMHFFTLVPQFSQPRIQHSTFRRNLPRSSDVSVSGLGERAQRIMVSPVNILMLLTNGFGGFGGIAKFNRDFMQALDASSVVALDTSSVVVGSHVYV